MSSDTVQYTLEDSVAVLRMDDGKVNALSHGVLDGLAEGLDRAQKDEAKALVLLGRPGRFTAGFDLSVMQGGGQEAMIALVTKGAELGLRIFESPIPTVLGVTGHAVAMGAVLTCCADERIGAEGNFKIGFNEIQIGMTLPHFLRRLAEERLSKRHLQRATLLAEPYSSAEAVDAGFLDRLVPLEQVAEAAMARARELGERLNPTAFRISKALLRRKCVEELREELAKGVA
jgi:enoyl-CoA hydratase